ncbi:hypothetical protein VP1G_04419 [Cytospora mali]|uniref:VOC domain-containing protein n=1 Tax=Cytospora mali TaxID=578113 RepID=A0A194UZQ4_CYTMA|nr:hypothetical protein VP1G_04419 [Valsa mali var. pyri (nom. inval.)]
MPFDFDRIIDYQLYLATQQCLAPYLPRRRNNNATTSTSACTGSHSNITTTNSSTVARVSGDRRSFILSLLTPRDASTDIGSGREEAVKTPPAGPLLEPGSRSLADAFVTAPFSGLDTPGVVGSINAGLARGSGTVTETKIEGDSGIEATIPPAGRPYAPRGWDRSPVDDIDKPVVSGGSGETVGETEAGRRVTVPVPEFNHVSSTRGDPSIDAFAEETGYRKLPGKVKSEVGSTQPRPDAAEEYQPPYPPSRLPATASPSQPPTYNPSPLGFPQDPNQLSRISAITLLVEDLPATKRFYEQVFSIEPIHEDENSAAFYFNGGSLIFTLYISFDARENSILGHGVHVGRMRGVGRRFQLSVAVEDVDEVYARLRGLEREGRVLVIGGLTEPCTRPWGVRTVMFQDPAGHCWEVWGEV